MELQDFIAKLMLNDLKHEHGKAKINIEIDLASFDISMNTENVSNLTELTSYLQYAIIENLKVAGVTPEKAKGSFELDEIVSQAYEQPSYLTLNGKNYKEEK